MGAGDTDAEKNEAKFAVIRTRRCEVNELIRWLLSFNKLIMNDGLRDTTFQLVKFFDGQE